MKWPSGNEKKMTERYLVLFFTHQLMDDSRCKEKMHYMDDTLFIRRGRRTWYKR